MAVLCVAAGAIAGRSLAEAGAKAELERRARAGAQLRAAMLQTGLEAFRFLPSVLAQDPDVRAALDGMGNAGKETGALQDLDRKLELLAEQTRAAAIYLVDRTGRTIAANNWRLPGSFVGINYAFRPYFRDAMDRGSGELFALGTVSGRPGLYIARRVELGGAALGVIVVKVRFEALEAQWRAADDRTFVAGAGGTVLITSVPEWRFKPMPIVAGAQHVANPAPLPTGNYLVVSAPTSRADWTLYMLVPFEPALSTARTTGQLLGAVTAALLLLGAGVLLARRARAREQARRREAARRELETRVADRTRELRSANERLVVEMEERRRAEASLHALQDELVQANKLAVLGQIAAGVAHEINQPVAAIRSYVDNAGLLLARGETSTARANLVEVASLTERIGLITRELRAFGRKSPGEVRAVPVEDAVSGALLLVGARLRHRGIRLEREGSGEQLQVIAERIRLEQVLVNLLQNAIDALDGVPDATVRLAIGADARYVRITVSDNGPGLAPGIVRALFTPFVTSKPQGLGLGLVISRDILAEFRGALEHVETGRRGAVFVITLERGP